MITTLNKIRAEGPCTSGWQTLLRHLGKTAGDDEPLALLTVLDSNGLDDALWCLSAVDGFSKEKRLFAVWCARQVAHLSPDASVDNALAVAEAYAHGMASAEQLAAARAAAEEAAEEADGYAARAAAGYAAGGADGYAAWAAARAAAGAAAGYAAGGAARAAQASKLRSMLTV